MYWGCNGGLGLPPAESGPVQLSLRTGGVMEGPGLPPAKSGPVQLSLCTGGVMGAQASHQLNPVLFS